jgi:hypothetical protein
MKLTNLLLLIVLAAAGLFAQRVTVSSPVPYVNGTTGSIGGSLLAVGTPATGTATVTGVAAGRPCFAAPSDGTGLTSVGSGLGVTVGCVVTSSGTATVYVGVAVAGTPVAKTYSVVAFP